MKCWTYLIPILALMAVVAVFATATVPVQAQEENEVTSIKPGGVYYVYFTIKKPADLKLGVGSTSNWEVRVYFYRGISCFNTAPSGNDDGWWNPSGYDTWLYTGYWDWRTATHNVSWTSPDEKTWVQYVPIIHYPTQSGQHEARYPPPVGENYPDKMSEIPIGENIYIRARLLLRNLSDVTFDNDNNTVMFKYDGKMYSYSYTQDQYGGISLPDIGATLSQSVGTGEWSLIFDLTTSILVDNNAPATGKITISGMIDFSRMSPVKIPRDPIYIRGNENFTPANGVRSGSGTENDPYIIEGWEIDASSTNGIEIRNTTAYFIVKNCLVENAWNAYNYGIYLENVRNGGIENTITDNNLFGISLDHSNNNTLSSNTTDSNNSTGIHLWYSDNNILAGNTAENNTAGIHLWYSDNNILTNNNTENNVAGINLCYSDNNTLINNTANYRQYDGIYLLNSTNNTLTSNTTDSNNRNGIYLDNSSNNALTGNTTENNTWGIYLRYSDNNILTSNTTENNYSFGIDLRNSCNNTLKNSTVLNNTGYSTGIYLAYSSNNNTLDNNTASNNSQSICLSHSDNNTVSNNTVENGDSSICLVSSNSNTLTNNIASNNFYGIELENSDNNTLISNIASNNIDYGIQLADSNNNILAGNTTSNDSYGIYLGGSNYNTLIGNTVSNNTVHGIYVGSSNNNLIYKNYFSNNYSAYDHCTNIWDNGYPSGGNYWSDYSGADNYHGENQDIPGPDGIGDIPYFILGGAKDRYPLIRPNMPPPALSLVSPENNAELSDNTPTFEWTSVSDPSGVTYQIQIDDNSDFSSPVYFAVGLAENTHTLSDENALTLFTQHFWRVRAKSETGAISDWSQEWNFTVVPIGTIGVLLMPLLFLLPFLLILRRQNKRYYY